VPSIDRGEVWLVDLGLAAKVRPCLVLSIPPQGQERVLITLVPHTTSVRSTRFEIDIPKPFLKPGAFDCQGLVTVPPARFIRRLGHLQPPEMQPLEDAVKHWLGLRS